MSMSFEELTTVSYADAAELGVEPEVAAEDVVVPEADLTVEESELAAAAAAPELAVEPEPVIEEGVTNA